MVYDCNDAPHACGDRNTDDISHPDGSIAIADSILHGSLEQKDPESTSKRKSESSIIDESERGIEENSPSHKKKYRNTRGSLS
jgi:hypothetical protein